GSSPRNPHAWTWSARTCAPSSGCRGSRTNAAGPAAAGLAPRTRQVGVRRPAPAPGFHIDATGETDDGYSASRVPARTVPALRIGPGPGPAGHGPGGACAMAGG